MQAARAALLPCFTRGAWNTGLGAAGRAASSHAALRRGISDQKKREMARKSTAAQGSEAAPKKKTPGRIAQMREVFRVTRQVDRTLVPWMLGVLLASVLLFMLLTWLLLDSLWYGVFVGLAFGILAALLVLARKAERAAFSRIAGQKGAALAAMQSIRRGWYVEDEPAGVDPRSQTMIYRAYGRKGIVLVADDDSRPSMRLLERETKELRRVLPHDNVPMHQIIVGDGEGEVPLHRLPSYMTRMKNVLTKAEAAEVSRRLSAMARRRSLRNQMPKGVDPMRARPNRKAMRGR